MKERCDAHIEVDRYRYISHAQWNNFSHEKKEEILPVAITCIKLEGIMLR